MYRFGSRATITLLAILPAFGCVQPAPTQVPLPLRRYVGCYAIRGIGVRSGQSTWRTLRLTAQLFKHPAITGYLAAFDQGNYNFYWFLQGDTIHLRPAVGMVNGWVDSLALWPSGEEFEGSLHEVTDMVGTETTWDLKAGRIWCKL